MKTITQNLQTLKSSLEDKPQINIVVVTKTRSPEEVQEAIAAGATSIGENRVQEAKNKFVNIKKDNSKIELHLTGPLQSNKVKDALLLFDVFHTIDREKIAKEFSKHQRLLKDKKFFVQINRHKLQQMIPTPYQYILLHTLIHCHLMMEQIMEFYTLYLSLLK